MQNIELEQRCLQAYEAIGKVPFEISAFAQALYLNINDNMFTNIKKSEYKKVRFDDRKWRTTGYSYTSKIAITPDGRLMKEINNRLVPLAMKDFCSWYTSECAAGRLMHIIAYELIKQNIFFRDVLEDMLAVGCILPVTVDEVMKCHNRKELLCMKYKTAKDIHIKYNKQNLNLSYLIIKAMPYVDGERNRNILLQQKEISLLTEDIAKSHRNEKLFRFLINIIQRDIQTRIRSKNKKLRGKYMAELENNVLTELLPDERAQFLAYSFTDSNAEHCLDGVPKRYTVEFRLKGNRYYVEQVQGKRDRVNASKMKTYIQEILDSYQNGVST